MHFVSVSLLSLNQQILSFTSVFFARALAYETDFQIAVTLLNILPEFEFSRLLQTANKGVLPHLHTFIVFLTLIYKIHGAPNVSEIYLEEGIGGDARLYIQNLSHLVTQLEVVVVSNHIVFIRAHINNFFT